MTIQIGQSLVGKSLVISREVANEGSCKRLVGKFLVISREVASEGSR